MYFVCQAFSLNSQLFHGFRFCLVFEAFSWSCDLLASLQNRRFHPASKKGKGVCFHIEVIRDFCEKVFHFCFLFKIRVLGNVPIYHNLTDLDSIWHEY